MVNVGGKAHQGFNGHNPGDPVYPDISTLDELLSIDIRSKKEQDHDMNGDPQTLEHLAEVLTKEGMDLAALQKIQQDEDKGRPALLKQFKAWGIKLSDAQKLATAVAKTKPIFTTMKYTRGFDHPNYRDLKMENLLAKGAGGMGG